MKFRKAISILLAVLMVASAASIGGILAYHFPKEKSVNELSSGNIVISEEEQEEVRKEKPERDDSVLEMEDKNPVPDEKLEEYKNNDSSVPAGNLSTEEPKVQEDKSEYFDTDNNIKIPFDQIYPEEFEQGVFEYDDETLMFKVKSLNNKREKELFEAGIIKTEEMMVLEDAVWYVGYIEKDA
ncbi:MAG: hypothetical protein IKZ06_04220, partial [Oscillospiraceae bacterium]|nr:hypothetical protein [Oscillospiraceae bacterium]